MGQDDRELTGNARLILVLSNAGQKKSRRSNLGFITR